MFIIVTKWFCIAALVLASLFDGSGANRLLLECVVFAGATIVVVQAVRARALVWVLGFIGLALIFNPVIQYPLPGAVVRWLDVVCIASFLVSLVFLKSPLLLSIPSILDGNRKRESL